MNEETFNKISASLQADAIQFPNCRVASCACNSNTDEWVTGCHCTCHWWQMPGGINGNWTLADAAASAKEGRPIKSN